MNAPYVQKRDTIPPTGYVPVVRLPKGRRRMNQIILPSLHCYRLKHRIESRARPADQGRYDYCVVCTLGWEMARAQLGDDALADEFVNELRAS